MARDTYKYRFFSEDGEQLHCGITNNLYRRQGEHRRRFGEPDGYIQQEGRRTTRQAASNWERQQRCSPYDRYDETGFDEDFEYTGSHSSNVGDIVAGVATGAVIAGGVMLAGALLAELLDDRP